MKNMFKICEYKLRNYEQAIAWTIVYWRFKSKVQMVAYSTENEFSP